MLGNSHNNWATTSSMIGGVLLPLICVVCCSWIKVKRKHEPWGLEQGSNQSRSGNHNHWVTTTLVLRAIVFSYIKCCYCWCTSLKKEPTGTEHVYLFNILYMSCFLIEFLLVKLRSILRNYRWWTINTAKKIFVAMSLFWAASYK